MQLHATHRQSFCTALAGQGTACVWGGQGVAKGLLPVTAGPHAEGLHLVWRMM